MKAEELRIGNYVYENGTARKIYSLDVGGETAYRINDIPIVKKTGLTLDGEQVFKLIPITEERLYKLSEGCIIEKHKDGEFTIDRFRLIWKAEYKYWYVIDDVDLTYITKIEYVHNWQNVFYALNGHE